MDRGAWWAIVHGVAKSRTRLINFTFHFHALEKEMATHSTVLAGRIPGTGEPAGLLSMGSHRVGHDWTDLAAAAVAQWWRIRLPSRRLGFHSWVRKIPRRRKWLATLIFLPGKSHRQRSLVSYIVHGVAEEPDTTYWLNSNKKTWC